MGDAPRSDGGAGDDADPLAETIDGPQTRPAPAVKRWGPLELRAALGAGAFGIVYRAWDARLHREVALKLIQDALTRQGFAAAVIEEARLLASVRHPNVVIVHGADEIDGSVGIWMELVEGRTLTAVLGQSGAFSADEAALVGIDVCRALAAVHKAGLIHRDVKADNIMRENGGRLVLMDFGAGTRRAADGDPVDIAGTPLYWAPEVLAGAAASVATDVYSVGVLLYHLATEKYPVSGRTIEELRVAHSEGRRSRIQDERPDLPAAFVRAVEGALEPDPARRFKTAGELLAALDEAHASAPDPGTVPAAERDASPAIAPARRRTRVIVGMALTALAVAGIVFTAGRPLWRATASPNSASLTSINSLAVLPFEVTSNDPSEKYLANAVPVELTTNLAQFGDFKTVPWTFTKDLAAKSKTLADVVSASGADGIVTGSVQLLPATSASTSRRVRIAVLLSQGRTGSTVWSQSFEDDVGNFMGINSRIADQIAGHIRVKLAVRRDSRVVSPRAINPDAMELYLRARDLYMDRSTQQQTRQALEYFTSAIGKDPTFAEAYVGVADSYLILCAFWNVITQEEAFPKIEAATSRAIALDDASARVWSTRAYARYLLAWDWSGAEHDFKRALMLPADDTSLLHDRYAEYLTAMGRHAEAIAETEAMVAAAPQLPNAHRTAAWSNFFARRYDAAIDHLEEALRLNPKFHPARTLLGRALVQKGLYAEGIAELESVSAVGQPQLTMLAHAYARAGQPDKARRTLKAHVDSGGEDRSLFQIALVYVALGESDRALDRLERAVRVKDTALVNLNTDPRLDSLRLLPRFIALRRQLKFPE